MGVNVSQVVYWSTEQPFVDLFKCSSPWISQAKGADWGKGPPLDLTPNGWVRSLQPGQSADVLMLVGDFHHDGGDYLLLYDGKGGIEFFGAGRTAARSPGRDLIQLRPGTQQLRLKLVRTDPSDPVRNIRLIPVGAEATYRTHPFRPEFLARWMDMGVIRFMDWGRTNGSKIVEWADRPTPGMQTQGSEKGVAAEYMIELANELHADPWFCVPHMASDDYVRHFAELVKQKLDPGLKVYVEYSNEVWNRAFEQQPYAQRQGVALHLSNDPFEASQRFYARRAVQIFQIFGQVFGGHDRIVRVLSSQFVNPWVAKVVLDAAGPGHADALAIAPYFGGNVNQLSPEALLKLTPTQILVQCVQGIQDDAKKIKQDLAVAQEHGLPLIAYEAGQGLGGNHSQVDNDQITALLTATNRNPGMKPLYLFYLRTWRQAGGQTICLYDSMGNFTKWGSWGLVEKPDEPHPKYDGVMQFLGEAGK